MNTAPPARPPTLKQLEASAQKAREAREYAWERVVKSRAALCAALDGFHDYQGHETAAFQALCAARQGRTPDPAVPPAPETLTAADEED